ncbi:MAG: polyprenyl synthetase family protein, partial [Blastocatellia bacterium]|nr:polyprenyl synthetase family protein [Blastocatellia bacterium]
AYQIYDDLLDELGEPRILGKPLNQDQRHSRPTFVSMYGVSGAKRIALQNIAEGQACLQSQFGCCEVVEMLSEIANTVVPNLDTSKMSKKCEIAIVG